MPDSRVRLDVDSVVDEYLAKGDVSSENANCQWTPNGLLMAVGGEGLAKDNLMRMAEAGHSELAEMHKVGIVHIHDLSLSHATPYCAGNSLPTLLAEGITSAMSVSKPAKHLRTAVNHIINFVGAMSNEFAGAQAFNEIDIHLAPYAYKAYLDFKKSHSFAFASQELLESRALAHTEREVKQCIQELMFHLNFNSRWGSQTPFTNITLAVTVPGDLKNSAILVAGQPLHELGYPSAEGKTYSDMGVWQKMIIDALLDTYIEGDANGNGFTFPILTTNVTEEFFSMPIKDKIFELTAKFGTPYFQNFINGKSGGQKINPDDVRSMCPLHGDTLVMVKTDHKGISIRRIQDVHGSSQKGTKYSVFHAGRWIEADVVVNKTVGMKKFKMSNNSEVVMDLRHEQPIKRAIGEGVELLMANDIEVGMWVPFNSERVDDFGSKEAGFAVGLYVGDGSISSPGSIYYSLNKNTDKENAQRVSRFFEDFGFRVSMSEDCELLTLRVSGASNGAAISWIKQYVSGDNAREKSLTQRVFNAGGEFLDGLLEGWYASDGGNRGRIYSSSEQLLTDFESVCALLGRHYRTSRGTPDTRGDRLSDTPVHTLKFHTRQSYANQFFFEDGYWWFKVESIEKVNDENAQKAYCFVVKSEDHLFTLGNGMVTHNCRLQINQKEIQRHVGGLFGNADQTGSLQVVTISLPFLAMAAKSQTYESVIDCFHRSLLNTMETIKKEQLWKRDVVESFFKRGLFPTAKSNFKRGFDTFFTTIGFIGLWECVQILTGDEDSLLTQDGLALGVEILTKMYERVVELTEETGKLFNLEATPAESASYKLAKKALKYFPDIPHRGLKKSPYFTNSCHIPVEYQGDLQAIFSTQNVLQTIPSGGTVVHFYLGDEMTAKQVEDSVRFICENTELPYFSMTTVYSMCEICGRIPGAHEVCPNEHTEEQVAELKAKRPELVA